MFSRIAAVKIYKMGDEDMMVVLWADGSVVEAEYGHAIFNYIDELTLVYDERYKPDWDEYCDFYKRKEA